MYKYSSTKVVIVYRVTKMYVVLTEAFDTYWWWVETLAQHKNVSQFIYTQSSHLRKNICTSEEKKKKIDTKDYCV